jgi:hypothetical protein
MLSKAIENVSKRSHANRSEERRLSGRS